jgi:glycosyltransferase involved in cell wall biosynthesis
MGWPGAARARLLYISQGNVPSRAANSIHVAKMSEALACLVGDFALITLSGSRSRSDFDLWGWYGIERPFRVVGLPLEDVPEWPFPRGFRHPGFARAAAAHARRRRPDLAITRSPDVALKLTARGVPVILEWHGPLRELPAFAAPLRLGVRASLAGVVTIHESLAAGAHAVGLARDRVAVLPDAVDLARYATLPTRALARGTVGWPPDGPVVVYAGHLYEGRGIETILACAARLPGVTFAFVGGWDEDVERRKTDAAEAGLTNVVFAGFVPNGILPRYLAAADVLVMPHSRRDPSIGWTSPLKLFEYMAAARPIVASSHAVFESVLAHGRNCLLVAPDDPTALAACVTAVLEDEDLAARLGRGARDDVAAFTWTRRAERLLEFAAARLGAPVGAG